MTEDYFKPLTYLKGKVLEIMLYSFVVPCTANQSLGIKYGVLRITSQLVLGGITNETLPFSGKSHVLWCDTVTLVIGDNFHSAILEDTNTENTNQVQIELNCF